jgi:hypothetical protein
MQLRDYQLQAVDAVHKEWAIGHRKTLLVLPTGAGKTIVFAKVIEDEVTQGGRVLVLAHRGVLLEQAADKLAAATGLGCAVEKAEESCRGSFFSVVVGSVQTLMREKRLSTFPKNYFSTIIVDETHHVLADSYQRVLEHFEGAQVLGVTATPDRGDMRNLGTYFDSLAYEYTLPRAIKDGYLCKIEAQTIPLKLDLTGVAQQAGDFKTADLGSALDPYLHQIAEEMAICCAGRKTVVFLPLIATGKKFTDILNARGIAAVEVNGGSPDRAEILSDFSCGRYSVLCNAMLLTEGWDQPDVDCIVVLRPTKIRSLYCLDTKTEVLTQEGWKNYVEIGENVAAFDVSNGEIRFVPATGTIRRPLQADEYFCSLSGPSTDLRVTNRHRMIYDNKRHKGWKIKTAEELAKLQDGAHIPVSGQGVFNGIPLTDDEIRFIGWVMTDGSINKHNNAISITQNENSPYVENIEKCIKGCGFKYGKHIIDHNSQFHPSSKKVLWTISRGEPRGRDKHLQGWGEGKIPYYLSKDLDVSLFDMTEIQFDTMLEAIHMADGHKQNGQSWTQRSYHIGKGNKSFIERLQIMAIQRGYRANISVETANRKKPLYKLHLKKQDFAKVGSVYDGRPTWIKEPHKIENCWCVENELETLVTRRNGKVAIVGNCVRP